MPYFVFRLAPGQPPQLVSTFEKYMDAKNLCRELRARESPDDPNTIRMAHATSEYEARRLLVEKRKPGTPLEEWEA
jgi:hypothetical protein